MKIEALTVEIGGEEITLQIKHGVLLIDTSNKTPVIINVRNAGIPGIIGPDIKVDINQVVEAEIFRAQLDANC